MSLSEGIPAVMNVTPTNGYNNGGNCGGWGGDWSAWIVIFILFACFGGWGNGFGGGFGGGNGAGFQGALTRGDLCMDMNFNDVQNGVRNISDAVNTGFANLNSTICHQQYDTAMLVNGLSTNMMQGFHGVDNSVCTLGYQNAQLINGVQNQISNCCCGLESAIQGVNYNMATNTCNLQNTMNNNTRDIIETQNAGTRAILDYLCKDKIDTLQSENQALRLAASQAAQNNVIGSRIDAATAEILRKTGSECPLPAYIVQPPQPVSFATNCSGQATFNNGYGYNNGCGCNSGCCGCNG